MRAEEIMRVHVNTVLTTDTVSHLLEVFELYQQRIVPVVDEIGQVCGIIGASELCAALSCGASEDSLVSDYLQVDYVWVRPETELDLDLTDSLFSDKSAVLVLAADEKLVGLITDVSYTIAKLNAAHAG